MARLPLVAILRGVRPSEAVSILRTLLAEGFALIETPLNSPEPLDSIRAMRRTAPPEVLVGAGTVKRIEDVHAVADAGGDLIIMPHADASVIEAAKARGLIALPGSRRPPRSLPRWPPAPMGLRRFLPKCWRRRSSGPGEQSFPRACLSCLSEGLLH